jgi:4-amino-4-deoxy-L-arabinose transferase-like glycosyltransferase
MYILVTDRNGDAFIDEFFWKHHFSRFASSALQHVRPVWFYVPVLIGALFPWSPLMAGIYRRRYLEDPRLLLLLVWLAFGFVFFSASTNKLPGYILPLLPPAAILMGRSMTECRIPAVVVATCALLLGLIPTIGDLLPEALVSGLSRSTLNSAELAWLGLATVFALAVWVLDRRWGREWGVLLVALGACLGVMQIKVVVYPALEKVATVRPFWHSLRYQDVCTEGVHRALQYGLSFYAHRSIPSCAEEPARLQITSPAPGQLRGHMVEP